MDEIYSMMTDKYNCESSDRTDDYFLQNCQPLHSQRFYQREEIEFKFRQSKQDYIFPRIPYDETPENFQTIESPHRLKTEGNEKSEDQLDLNFNFNSSSEHLSEDAVVLQPKPYQQKLKPPQPKKTKHGMTQQTYRTILNDLERKLHTINCKDFVKKKFEPKGAPRAKSNSNRSISKKNQRPFEIDTKTSSVKKSMPTESKKSLSKTHLATILMKQKSKSNPTKTYKTNNVFNVNNSHINLNVNINSQTMDLQQQALTVAQILQKKQTLNRSTLSSYCQRNSNRCSTEPFEEMKARLSSNVQKNKTSITNQSRCNTGMEIRAQSTIQYLNQMKQQQQIKKNQKLQQQSLQQNQKSFKPTMQIKQQQQQIIKQRSSTNSQKPRLSIGKYKKYNLSIEMN